MPSRAPLTDEEMQLLRDRMERYEAAKSTRTPPPAPSQTFGMRGGSSRRTGPRQRYDPQAAAEERHANRMRLMELRKAVEADKAERKAKKVRPSSSTIRSGGDPAGAGLKSSAFYSTARDPSETTVAEDYAASQPSRDDRPISSMYSVTPRQYRNAYNVEFTGSDPDSMRRLLALQNGTSSVYKAERGAIDQQIEDAQNAEKYANMKPAVGDYSGLVAEPGEPGSNYQRRANLQIPEADVKEARRLDEYDAAMAQAGGVPNQGQIDAMDRQRAAELERIRRGRIFDLNSSSLSERYGIPPAQTMSQIMDPDSPMAIGPGRKGLVPRK